MDLQTVSLMQMVARESDWIVFMDHEDDLGNPLPSWRFLLNLMPDDETRIYDQPRPGDTAYVC